MEFTKLAEEIVRNYNTLHTYHNDPYSWEDNTDIDANVYINQTGSWSAEVKSKSNPSLSTKLHTFADQYSADHWVRQNVDRITRATINEIALRQKIRNILLSTL